MRLRLPRRFCPDRKRVGAPITDLSKSTMVPTFDGVDWFAIPSPFRAVPISPKAAPGRRRLSVVDGDGSPFLSEQSPSGPFFSRR
jgi:hypothetical protein